MVLKEPFGQAAEAQGCRDRGATMVEYGLIVLLIALVAVAGVALMGPPLAEIYTDLAGAF